MRYLAYALDNLAQPLGESRQEGVEVTTDADAQAWQWGLDYAYTCVVTCNSTGDSSCWRQFFSNDFVKSETCRNFIQENRANNF